ncbi:MAG: outer membrane beta-barrel protein [Cytophagales bacterium]|nr:outer membrane beta-barrel protein [Cytophagales bacterium]
MYKIFSKEGLHYWFPLFFALFSFHSSNAQFASLNKSMEFGLSVGVLTYTGDLYENVNLNTPKLGGQFFYRHNFDNEIISIKASILGGSIAADEKYVLNGALQENRKLSFSTDFVEIAGTVEYNFFNYRDLKGRFFMSPYLFGGLGLTAVWGGSSPTYFNIPFGIGVRYQLSKHWNLGFELGARRTFTDDLDGFNDDSGLSSSSTQDWYYYTGVSISYTIYKQSCPTGHPSSPSSSR